MKAGLRWGLVLVVALSAGCAARQAGPHATDLPDPRHDVDLFDRAQALVRQGCYACLLEAQALHAAVRQPDPGDGRDSQLFEIDLLIALRERELAMDAGAALARARMRATTLPAASEAARYVDLAEELPPDARGTPARDRSPAVAAAPAWARDTLSWLDTRNDLPLLTAYLRTAVECRAGAAGSPGQAPGEAPRDDPPLLMYRRAICGNRVDAGALAQVEQEVPRFVEASLFRARSGLGTAATREGADVRARLANALMRLPGSPAIPFELGSIMSVFRSHAAAADHFSAVLALREHHDEARLRRAIAYTYLDRSTEAIAELTLLLDGTAAPVRADAYYWRAFNWYRRTDLDRARADSDAAKALRWDAQILALAGIIEHDQRDFDIARQDLTLAARLNPADCTARWYLALVELAVERWSETAAHFGRAADCYAESAAANERERDLMTQREGLEPEFRAAQIAGFDAAIADARSQESAAALNAAVNHARSGARAEALVFLERAERDPARQEMGAILRKALDPVE